jgi:hypothetical protein
MGPCRISSSSRAQVVERLTLRTPETGKEKAVAKAVAAGAGGNGAGSSGAAGAAAGGGGGSSGDGSSQRQQAGRPPKAAQESISDVFWIPVLRVRLAVTCFLWFASGFSYYGLTLGVSSLAGNRYVNIAIMAAVEIPAVMLLIPLADSPWLGRKGATLIFFTVLGGCSALALLWSSDVGRITLNVVGRAASGTSARACAHTLVWLTRPPLRQVLHLLECTSGHRSSFPPRCAWLPGCLPWVPVRMRCTGRQAIACEWHLSAVAIRLTIRAAATQVRHGGMGLGSFSARVGSIGAPWAAQLGTLLADGLGLDASSSVRNDLPLALFGVCAVMAGDRCREYLVSIDRPPTSAAQPRAKHVQLPLMTVLFTQRLFT